jgi:arylsulfatase A-like enzyme
MKRKLTFVLLLVVAALAGAWLRTITTDAPASGVEPVFPAAAVDMPATRAPNILLIISDDFGMDVTSDMYPGLIDGLVAQYGPQGLNHPQYSSIAGRPASTPALDNLARQSMIFSNVWANPFCSPTRASILTGLYGARNGVLSYADPLSQRHTSFVRQLHDEGGYSTAIFGKWHMAGLPNTEVPYPGMKPKEAGFDLFKGNMHAAIDSYWDYDYEIQDASSPDNQWRTEKPPVKSLTGLAPSTYAPIVKVADAIEWITEQEAADPDKPWFAWLAFNLSHATRIQQPSAMAIPNADTLDETTYRELEACGGEFGSNNTGTCSGEALMRGMTNSVDTVIGKMLEAVDRIDPNTYVIYIGDNGTPMYARPNLDHIDNMYITKTGRGKGTAFESGARVAMAIRGPGITADTVNDEYVHAVDLFPTSLALAGLQSPAQVTNTTGSMMIPVDGVSLMPILFDGASTVRDPNQGYILTESLNLMIEGFRQVGARNAEWKVICSDNADLANCELYNLEDDPLEEYPLPHPQSCETFDNGSWTPADSEWHYCHLAEVIRDESFFRQGTL